MKTEEAKEIIFKSLKEKKTVKAHEINYENKGKIAFVQIYGIMAKLVLNGSVEMTENEGKKSYTLIDETKLNDEPNDKLKTGKAKAEEVKKDTKSKKKVGRDLTTYKFNNNEYNKGRLALAVITQYAKEKKPSLKSALLIFEDHLIPPYGCIKEINEAKKVGKGYPRFFIKPEEEVKLRDCNIAVSNQWTTERIDKLIAIAKKQFGYIIK
ncbi:MAG: hypothetical protein JNM51_09290 [Bacteroidia bacterium]|nr:hypothetical protein [Bacteroidia bacterium]